MVGVAPATDPRAKRDLNNLTQVGLCSWLVILVFLEGN